MIISFKDERPQQAYPVSSTFKNLEIIIIRLNKGYWLIHLETHDQMIFCKESSFWRHLVPPQEFITWLIFNVT